MAKIIGAEGQRGLEYALRRKEADDAKRDITTMRSRSALANNLTSLAADPDVDDPSLGYLGAAAMADPTGLMGGIASAFGAVAQAKAQNKKNEAVKEKRKSEAADALVQMKELYGEEESERLLNRFDETGERRKTDPIFVKNLLSFAKAKEGKEIADEKRAYDNTVNALNLSSKVQGIASNALDFEIRSDEFEKQKELKIQSERMAPGIEAALLDMGVKPEIAKLVATNPNFQNKYFEQEIMGNMEEDKQRKLYQTDALLRTIYPSEDAFVNSKNYPPEVAQHILGKFAAQPQFRNAQNIKINLQSDLQRLQKALPIARNNAINRLYPVIDQNRMPSEQFKEWYVNWAQTVRGLELDKYDDDDDPLDSKYVELLSLDAKTEGNLLGSVDKTQASRMATFQQDMIAKDDDARDKINAEMLSDPRFSTLQNNVANARDELANLLSQYPSMRGSVMPEPVLHDDQIRRMGPGTIFTKGNGGTYITLGEGSNVGGYGLSIDTERKLIHPATGQMKTEFRPLVGANSLIPSVLQKAGVSFTPLSNASNAGYRELTKAEMERIMPSFTGQMAVPPLLSTPRVDSSSFMKMFNNEFSDTKTKNLNRSR